MNCPVCKSSHITKAGLHWRGRGQEKKKVQKYQCHDCGKLFFDKEAK